MGRKKLITEEQLRSLIDEFYYKVCEGNANRLRIPEIGSYIRANGFPGLKDYIIRRDQEATAHIDELKKSSDGLDISLIVSFKTLDVDKFININRGDSRMKKALTELDQYYKSICESATSISQKFKQSEDKIRNLEKKLDVTSTSLEELKKNESRLKKEKKALSEECKNLRQIIDTYVYPEIANELLTKAGLLHKTDEIVNIAAVEENLIKAETEVKSESNVIKGMFHRFGE